MDRCPKCKEKTLVVREYFSYVVHECVGRAACAYLAAWWRKP